MQPSFALDSTNLFRSRQIMFLDIQRIDCHPLAAGRQLWKSERDADLEHLSLREDDLGS